MANRYPTDVEEIWKPVVGYEGFYEVSNLGRIKRVGAVPGATPGRILKPGKCKQYRAVTLSMNGQLAYFTVHSIVAAAFIGPRPTNYEINHKNGRTTDNRIDNLEYVTQEENRLHAKRMGLMRGPKRQWAQKLSPADVRKIRVLLSRGIYQYRIAKQFGVVQSVISNIKRGYRHKKIQ